MLRYLPETKNLSESQLRLTLDFFENLSPDQFVLFKISGDAIFKSHLDVLVAYSNQARSELIRDKFKNKIKKSLSIQETDDFPADLLGNINYILDRLEFSELSQLGFSASSLEEIKKKMNREQESPFLKEIGNIEIASSEMQQYIGNNLKNNFKEYVERALILAANLTVVIHDMQDSRDDFYLQSYEAALGQFADCVWGEFLNQHEASEWEVLNKEQEEVVKKKKENIVKKLDPIRKIISQGEHNVAYIYQACTWTKKENSWKEPIEQLQKYIENFCSMERSLHSRIELIIAVPK